MSADAVQEAIWREIILEEIESEKNRPLDSTPLIRPDPHGFYKLKRRNPKLYGTWTKHIRLCFDKFDWGYLFDNGKDGNRSKPRANKRNDLNFWLNRDTPKAEKKRLGSYYRRPRELSFKNLEAHCQNEMTIYSTSHPTNHYAVLLLDIDDKEGKAGPEDVLGVYRHLDDLFPGFYHQSSTFGKGYHGFLFVHYPKTSVAEFRVLVRRLERALRLAIHARFHSTFEIKGTPAKLNRNGTYRTCGQPAKFPRLTTDADIESYLSCPAFSVEQIEAVIEKVSPAASSSSSSSDIDMPENRRAARKPDSDLKRPLGISISEEKKRKEGVGTSDPCQRMNRCGWNLSVSLKRAATETEIWQEYHRLDLDTGSDDDGNRRKLCRDSAVWLAAHFEPCKGEGFDPAANIELIEKCLSREDDERVQATFKAEYTHEQLAVVLHCIERGSTTRQKKPRWQFTAPNNGFTSMFEKIGIEVKGNGGALRNTLASMKAALVAADLAEVVDANWYVGKGKSFGLGPSHPRYREYKALKMSIEAEGELPPGVIKLTRKKSKCRS